MANAARPKKRAGAAADAAAARGPRRIDVVERWLAQHRWKVVAAIVAIAILPRVFYFMEVCNGPLAAQHLWDQSDMNYFDAWAKAIAGGDWLSRDVRPPLHQWHLELADAHFQAHPEDDAAALGANADPAQARRMRAAALWDRWSGGGRFYQDPLYPYLVALTYSIFGEDVRWVFAWQMLLGVLSVTVVYAITWRCFGEIAAAIAGAAAALYGPLMFYEAILLRESAITFAGLAITWLAFRALARGKGRSWIVAGIAGGIAMLLKGQFALLMLLLAIVIAVEKRKEPKAALKLCGLFFAGIAMALLPLAARNMAVGVAPLSLASNGTPTAICSNAVDASPQTWGMAHAARIMHESQGRFAPALWAALRTHPDFASIARLVWGKFALAWHWGEIPNNENIYFYRLHSTALRLMPMSFTIIAPLGLIGMAIALRRFRRCMPLFALVLSALVPLVMFFVLSRLRLPLALAMIPFAAWLLAQSLQWIEARRWMAIASAALATVAIALWTARPLPPGSSLIRAVDYQVSYNHYYIPRAQEAEAQGDWNRVAAILEDSFRRLPADVHDLGRGGKARHADQARLARLMMRLHTIQADALERAGRPAEAQAARSRAAAFQSAQ